MMNRIVTFFVMVALLGFSTDRALATDVGVDSSMYTIQDAVTADGIINFDKNGTLTVNLNGTGVSTISVVAGKAAVFQFLTTTNKIFFKAGAGTITLGAGASLTIIGSNAGAGIDFATNNAAATLTVNGSIAGAVNANVLIVGNNTLTVSAAATFAGIVSIGGASAVLDVDAATTVTTLTMTGALNITPADTMVLTLTNPVSVGANALTVTGSGAGGAEAINGTITLNNAASQLTTAGTDVDDILGNVAIVVSADGATLDVNFNTSPPSVTQNAGAGHLTLQVAAGKVLTTTVDVNDNILTTSQAGTISTVQLDTAGGTLNVDESHTITTYTLTVSATLDVAATKTLTVTNGLQVGANRLTLSTGTGTISRVDATTGTITDNGGSTITDLRITPGAGTFTWNGTGSSTVTDFLTNSTFATANILSKAGTGTLTVTNGVAGFFSTAGTQIINVTAGTLTYGTAGANNAVTFSQDEDEITVSSGATLTTFGSFTVGAAGANVNLDAVAGSTVNLSSTSGAETFTALADDDFNLLGTVNVNGADGNYTISDAFDYKFGNVNINTTGSLINNQPDGEMKFVPAATVTLTGDGTFIANGQASGTRITMDTTTGAGTFTIDRGSGNLTVQNVNLSRCIYTSSACGPGGCHISLSGVVFVTGSSGWAGDCCGGGTPPTPPPTNIDSAMFDAGGDAIVSTSISSGTSAEVTVSGASEGETMSVTLHESNTQANFMGMAGGDSGEGNGIPRTLTVDSTLQVGTFSAVLQICVDDADLTGSNLTGEQIGLYVFNRTTGEWQLAANKNLGDSQPTNTVGDYGVFQDGFESGDTCAWAVVDGFSTFAAGELTTYTLDARVAWPDSGSVKADPEQTVYSAGLLVNLTATPSPGLEFIDWLINEQDTSTSNPLTIAMDADTVAVAQFDEVDTVVEQFTLSVAVNEVDRGAVDVSPDALTYAAGTEVTLTATPASGFTFVAWSRSVDSPDANPLTVTVDSDLDITGFFFPEEAELFALEVTVDSDIAQSGTVAVSPALEAYETGTESTLTATPADGFQFAGWTGDATGTDNPLVVTISSNLVIGATFDLDETLGDSDNGLNICGAVGPLYMTLMLLGLAGLRTCVRRRLCHQSRDREGAACSRTPTAS